MPYKFEKKGTFMIHHTKYDRRIKLTDEQKEEIRERRAREGLSQRALAREYCVSRRLITFVLNPKAEERNRELAKERGSYYERHRHARYIKSHRRHKNSVYKLTKPDHKNETEPGPDNGTIPDF